MEKEFTSEVLAYYLPPDRFDDLAMEYHQRAEDYDKTVCTGRKGPTAMPANARESALVNKNARHLIDDIARREGLDIYAVMNLRTAITANARKFEQSLRN